MLSLLKRIIRLESLQNMIQYTNMIYSWTEREGKIAREFLFFQVIEEIE